MNTLKLSTWQREISRIIVESTPGRTLGQLKVGMDLINVLELSDEEKEEIGYEFKTDIGQAQWQNNTHVHTITLSNKQLELLKDSIENFSGWPQANAAEALDLAEKLGIDIDG